MPKFLLPERQRRESIKNNTSVIETKKINKCDGKILYGPRIPYFSKLLFNSKKRSEIRATLL